MRRLPPMKAILAFEAAARHGSFGAAALELNLTPSAISHQIRSLEESLGISLFHRVGRVVELTDVGRNYAESVSEGISVIAAGTRSIERTGKSDILTIHTVPSFGTQWLMRRLSRFSAQFPEVDLRLNASVSPVNLLAEEADFSIRYGPTFPDAGVVITPLPAETIVVLCAPQLAEKRALRKPADLNPQTLIHSEVNLYTWRDWQRDHPGTQLKLDRGPRFDRSFMAISAAMDGTGVGLESRLLVEREVEEGRLLLPFGNEGPSMVCHHLCFLKAKAHLPKMKAFRDWLFDQLASSTS
ncbi:MAG: transcriptional regulator GcvA [Limnohabitans sp.]|nr:transcriptional regulator GcvA [Limnohabitans sp.]